MSRKSQTNTPERLEAAPGYVSSGISIFTRDIAAGHRFSEPEFQDHTPDDPARVAGTRWRSLSNLIGKNKVELRKIKAKLESRISGLARQNLERDREIKTRWIAKLLAEQDELIRKEYSIGASHV